MRALSRKIKLKVPRVRIKKRILRIINFTLPPIFMLVYIVIHNYIYGISPDPLNPVDTLYMSFVIALSLIPASIFEYRWEWELVISEYEVPDFLSALEGNLRAGLPMPRAIHEASRYVKHLRGKLETVVKATYLGETLESSIKYLRGGSQLIELLADYLVILSRSGEEIYRTIREFRESMELMVNYSRKIRDATRSFIATLYLVMFVYLVSTVVFLAAFIYPLSEKATPGVSLISRVNPDAMTSLVIYGALIEAITNGVVISYFTGSRYLSSLIHAVSLLFISILIYAMLVFMKGLIPIP